MSGFDSNLPPIKAPKVVYIGDPRTYWVSDSAPLPLTPEGDLDWKLIKGETADFRVTAGGRVELTITGGGFTRRYAGFVKGKINITSQ